MIDDVSVGWIIGGIGSWDHQWIIGASGARPMLQGCFDDSIMPR
jgi:hypothetical protein